MTECAKFEKLLKNIHQCKQCEGCIPFPPRPILQVATTARILIIGQAPGAAAHHANKPWLDKSGDRLRDWLGVSADIFYNPRIFAVIPMGFCFPGYKNKADAPPRKECAPLWHKALIGALNPTITLLVGRYAQQYYLPKFSSLTEAVRQTSYNNNTPYVLPHPSGRNNVWLKKNPWFQASVLPIIKTAVANNIGESIGSEKK